MKAGLALHPRPLVERMGEVRTAEQKAVEPPLAPVAVEPAGAARTHKVQPMWASELVAPAV